VNESEILGWSKASFLARKIDADGNVEGLDLTRAMLAVDLGQSVSEGLIRVHPIGQRSSAESYPRYQEWTPPQSLIDAAYNVAADLIRVRLTGTKPIGVRLYQGPPHRGMTAVPQRSAEADHYVFEKTGIRVPPVIRHVPDNEALTIKRAYDAHSLVTSWRRLPDDRDHRPLLLPYECDLLQAVGHLPQLEWTAAAFPFERAYLSEGPALVGNDPNDYGMVNAYMVIPSSDERRFYSFEANAPHYLSTYLATLGSLDKYRENIADEMEWPFETDDSGEVIESGGFAAMLGISPTLAEAKLRIEESRYSLSPGELAKASVVTGLD
jgi:hypothetical protein